MQEDYQYPDKQALREAKGLEDVATAAAAATAAATTRPGCRKGVNFYTGSREEDVDTRTIRLVVGVGECHLRRVG